MLNASEPIRGICNRSFRVQSNGGASDSGSGSGLGNVKGYLDTYGTMTVDGAFLDTRDYLLKSGFLADGHGSAFDYHYPTKAEIGIFTDVQETADGLQLTWEYHDDEHSQAVRAKTQKRLDNDKTCGLSIGFYVGDGKNPPIGWVYSDKEKEPRGIDYIVLSPQFYEELLPVYSAPEYLDENLERAESLSCIYILKRVHVFETSQTEIPANEVSQVAEVRTRLNKTMAQPTQAEIRAAREAKRSDARDTLDAMHRSLKRAKDAHEESSDHLGKLTKLCREMESHLSSETDDDEAPDEEKKPEEKGKKSGSGRALFSGGK